MCLETDFTTDEMVWYFQTTVYCRGTLQYSLPSLEQLLGVAG